MIAGFLFAICTFPTATGHAAYPEQPMRMLATGIGGNGDVTARILANGLTLRLVPEPNFLNDAGSSHTEEQAGWQKN